jgi:hypothetical protein
MFIENLEGRRLFSALAAADLNHDGTLTADDVTVYDSSSKSTGFVQRYDTLINSLTTDTSGSTITVR